jgi:hypothetical protein
VKIAALIRHSERTKAERDELEHAMREIERVQIMDSLSAIRMRSIARVTLKMVDKHELV